jgi:aspartyl aminopeptidase
MIYKNVGIELGYTGRKLGDVASIYGSEYGYHIGLVWLNQQLSIMGVLQINNQTNRGM